MLAPMAGYTDAAFRKICHDFGVGITVTEMISTKALIHRNRITEDLLKRLDDKVCAVQLFGHEPEDFVKCINNPLLSNFEIIDINMGCPMPKIFNNGDGCALMKDISLASRVIKAVRSNTKKLVSVKFRLGIDNNSINCIEFASMCKDSGADFITIHARTRQQLYSGKAETEYIAKVVDKVKIPVFANGDINFDNATEIVNQSGCFGIAIGRAALGNPQIFSKITGADLKYDMWEVIEKHYNLLLSYLQPVVVANEMKKHLAYYLFNMRNRKSVILDINRCNDVYEQMIIVHQFLTSAH